MATIFDKNKELVTLLTNNEELQKIFSDIAIQLITMETKSQRLQIGILLKEAAAFLEKEKIFLTVTELREAVATWATRRISWRIEKI